MQTINIYKKTWWWGIIEIEENSKYKNIKYEAFSILDKYIVVYWNNKKIIIPLQPDYKIYINDSMHKMYNLCYDASRRKETLVINLKVCYTIVTLINTTEQSSNSITINK